MVATTDWQIRTKNRKTKTQTPKWTDTSKPARGPMETEGSRYTLRQHWQLLRPSMLAKIQTVAEDGFGMTELESGHNEIQNGRKWWALSHWRELESRRTLREGLAPENLDTALKGIRGRKFTDGRPATTTLCENDGYENYVNVNNTWPVERWIRYWIGTYELTKNNYQKFKEID